MNKKLLLFILLSSMSASVYSARVSIKNLTDEKVWARINDAVTVDRQAIFDLINPHSSRRSSTALIQPLKSLGKPGVGIRPIEKVTFIRVTGYKEVTGTIRELLKIVNDLSLKYGKLIFLGHDSPYVKRKDEAGRPIFKIIYRDDFSNKTEKFELREIDAFTIKIPEIEEFTYNLGKQKITGLKEGVIELRSWDNAVRTDKGAKEKRVERKEHRQEKRAGRQEHRQEKRTGRQEHRQERRAGRKK